MKYYDHIILGLWGISFAFCMGTLQGYYARYFELLIVGCVASLSGALTFIISPYIIKFVSKYFPSNKAKDYTYSFTFGILSVGFPLMFFNILLLFK